MTVNDGCTGLQPCVPDQHKVSLGKASGGFKASGKGNPCPICGRSKDSDCRIGAEIVLCHHGSSHHPPEGLKPGDTHIGGDGQQWAYTKDTSDGRAATYVIHQPLQVVASPPRRLEVAQLPEAKPEPPSHLPDGQRLKYSDSQTVVVVVNGDSKKHIPYHINASGKEVKGAGAEPWPLWRQVDAIEYGAGKWIIETEGEKCAAWPRAAGLVAVSQPGHDTKEDSITGRYKALKAAGVAGVAYLADNDKTGAAKGNKCQKSAAAAGLPFLLLQAAEVWPGICVGGSIDDAPGSAQERAQVLQQAIQKAATSKTAKTSGQMAGTPAEPGTGNAIRLKPNQILKLLPEKVGDLRLNIRSGDVHTATGILNANDAGHLYLKLSSNSATWGKEVTADAVAYLANQNQFDPVADFLNDTGNELPMEQWQRLDQHLLGINDPIAAEFLPRYLIGAVARVFKPGCDVRQTPVLVGPQWRGKTALGRILFGAEHWISGVGDLGKDALMRLHTGWGIELAELDGVTRRSDQESLKAFLTETCDSIRRPYDVATVRHPRKFVFWGTSNGAALRDTTGNTRYVTIPIPDQMLPLEWAQRHRNALWARAVEQYKAGVDWNQCSEAIRNAIADRNDNFTELDPWHDRIAQVLKRKALELQLPVKVEELLQAVEMPIDRQKGIDGQRVRRIAESLGWAMERRQSGAERRRGLWPAVPQVPQAVPQACHKANPSDGNGFGTAATSATTKPKKLDEKGEQQQRQAPQASPLDTVGAKLVALMAETPNPSATSGSALVAPADHLVARLVAPVSPQTISGRQADEHRIRELGRNTDLGGWSDDDVAELRQSLEQADKRRSSGFAIPVQEAA